MPNISDSGGRQSRQRILRYNLYGKTTPLPITLLQVRFTCLRNISIEIKGVEHGLQNKPFFNLAPSTLRLAWGLLKANNNNISFICMTICSYSIAKASQDKVKISTNDITMQWLQWSIKCHQYDLITNYNLNHYVSWDKFQQMWIYRKILWIHQFNN